MRLLSIMLMCLLCTSNLFSYEKQQEISGDTTVLGDSLRIAAGGYLCLGAAIMFIPRVLIPDSLKDRHSKISCFRDPRVFVMGCTYGLLGAYVLKNGIHGFRKRNQKNDNKEITNPYELLDK